MARGSNQATGAATSAQNFGTGLQGNANSLFSTLAPALESQAANPSGYSPTDMSQMRTNAMQSAGGSTAGATGQGALLAARTRNAGTADAAIAKSARSAGQSLSQASTGIAEKDAAEKMHEHDAALSGLSGLEGEQISGANQALGIVPGAVNANTNATNSSYDWATDIFNPLLSSGAGYGKFSV